MAKKKAGGQSLSQHIRDYLASNPDSTPNQIVAGLKEQGIKVSTGLASNVKYTSGPGGRKRGRRKGAKRTVRRRRPGAQTMDISVLKAAAKYVEQVGDVDMALEAVKQVQALQVR
jgi:hypothetical protein